MIAKIIMSLPPLLLGVFFGVACGSFLRAWYEMAPSKPRNDMAFHAVLCFSASCVSYYVAAKIWGL